MKNARLIPLAASIALALVVNAGCMKCGSDVAERLTETAIEGAIEKSSGGKVDIDVGRTVDMSGCPAFLQYPGAKGIGKWSMITGEGSGSVYSFETADPRDRVAEWFKASCEGQGWKQAATMVTGDGLMLMYGSPDEQQSVSVMLATEEGKTTIAVTYGKK